MNWYEFINVNQMVDCQLANRRFEPPYWLHLVYNFGEFTIVLNSSSNFFVYYLAGPNFRGELFQIISCLKSRSHSVGFWLIFNW